MTRVLTAAFVVILVVAWARASAAATQASDRERAEAAFARAEQDDEALELGRALAGYDEARRLAPDFGRARRAEARSAELRSHAEDGFVPMAKLERVRRDPALSSSPSAIFDLVRDAEQFPEGLVRIEVWVLAAEAYAHRLARPDEADALLRRVLVDPRTDSVVGHKAARDLVERQLARRDVPAAEAALRLAGPRADPSLEQLVRRMARRLYMHYTCVSLVMLVLLMTARACATAARRGSLGAVGSAVRKAAGIAVAYAAYVALGGALLASGYEAGTSRPFLFFGAAIVPIALLARAWAAAGASTAPAIRGRATVCGLGALAAAFLVLEAVDVTFLEGMGL